jgi:hypothetical protein
MDFSNRNPQPASAAPSPQPATPLNANSLSSNHKRASLKSRRFDRPTVTALVAYLVAVVVLVVAVLLVLGLGGPKPEASYIDTSKLQAVFLESNQVYFGNIKSLNDKYIVLDNIYYPQVASSDSTTTTSSTNTRVSLVKLGCELHAPYDQMIINRDQVMYWENLQSTGQVAKAVATFQKENPKGQKCSTAGSVSGSTPNLQGGTPTAPSTTKP